MKQHWCIYYRFRCGMANQKLMLDKNNKLIPLETGNISYYVNKINWMNLPFVAINCLLWLISLLFLFYVAQNIKININYCLSEFPNKL